MPSFYPSTLSRHVTITSPDYYGPYLSTETKAMQSSRISQYNQGVVDTRYGLDPQEAVGYMKQSVQMSVGTNPRPPYTAEHKLQGISTFVSASALPDHAYGHSSAPVLPPIQVHDRPTDHHPNYLRNLSITRPQPQLPPKEEKVGGGVAAFLDYDMELMVDFVSEMAQGMYELFQSRICLADIDLLRSVLPNAVVPADFRKYVSHILTSTRLPSSTILLGLHYLTTRMSLLSAKGVFTSSTGHLYHMLTTALMLGSKFLDDNTFQNRSWAEVSKIAVGELNTLEMQWLLDIKWNLHIDSTDPQGFSAWLKQWESWKAKKVAITMDSLKLTPLDTSLRRQHSVTKHLPPTPIYTPPYSNTMWHAKERSQTDWQTPRYDQWAPLRSATEYSPPSAPETGPNTPVYYGRHDTISYGQAAPAYSMRSMPAPLQLLPSTAPSPYYPPYPQHYTPTSWAGHGMGCMCGYCLPHHDRYSMARGYEAQPVVG